MHYRFLSDFALAGEQRVTDSFCCFFEGSAFDFIMDCFAIVFSPTCAKLVKLDYEPLFLTTKLLWEFGLFTAEEPWTAYLSNLFWSGWDMTLAIWEYLSWEIE